MTLETPCGARRLLVFNCHESWVYQLGCLDANLDIVVGMPGRHTATWDRHARPLPAGARVLSYPQALTSPARYDAIVCHNPSDLLDVRHRPEPRILVLHLPVEARLVEENSRLDARQARQLLQHYVRLTGTHVVAVSELKGRSWGFTEDIVPFGFDPNDYGPALGDRPAGLRIANFVTRRRRFLCWDFHCRAFEGLPVTLVGHNPDLPGVEPSRDWDHLKDLLRHHRFYIHTADPVMEDGYNMATVEAMLAGLPVLGNRHPSSPIEHGVNGFLSDDPLQLRHYAERLLADPALAHRLGQAARARAAERFSQEAFRAAFEHSIATARRKRQALRQATTEVTPTPPAAPIVEVPARRSVTRPATRSSHG